MPIWRSAHQLPLVPFLLEQVALNPALMQADGMHPNEHGQPLLLDNVWPKLEPLLRARPAGRSDRQRALSMALKGVARWTGSGCRSIRPGCPPTSIRSRSTSLKALIEDACERYADRVAYHSMGTAITYRELERRSRAFGAWLQQRAGLKSGDRIAIMLPNLLQYPIAMFGALRAGLTVVNTNPLYTASELEHQLKDSGAAAVVVLENFAATLRAGAAATPACGSVIVTGVGDLLQLAQGRDRQPGAAPRAQEGAALADSGGARASARCSREGRTLPLQPVSSGSQRSGLPAVHRRHHRRRQGRDAHPRQHGGQHPAVRAPGSSRGRSTSSPSSARCRSITSSR